MAKKVHTTQLKGVFDMDVMEITEVTKDNEQTYSLLDVLREYEGRNISINIKEEQELEPVSEA